MSKKPTPKPALPQSGGSYSRDPKGVLKKVKGTAERQANHAETNQKPDDTSGKGE